MSQSPVPFVSPGWDGNEELPFHLRGLRKLGIRVYCHCLDLLLEVSYLSILNSSGPASEDLVKDVISQIIFFFFAPCKGSCSNYIKLNPDDANCFEKCAKQKLLWA